MMTKKTKTTKKKEKQCDLGYKVLPEYCVLRLISRSDSAWFRALYDGRIKKDLSIVLLDWLGAQREQRSIYLLRTSAASFHRHVRTETGRSGPMWGKDDFGCEGQTNAVARPIVKTSLKALLTTHLVVLR